MPEPTQLPSLEDTISKIDYLLCTLTDLLQNAEKAVPNDQIINGAVLLSADLVRDLEKISEAHPCL